MRIQEDPFILDRLKNLDVRIRKNYKKQTAIFIKDPQDPRLNNHDLQDEYEGLNSIDITDDYRAIYEKVDSGGNEIAYFILIATHEELYIKKIFTVYLKR